MEFNDEMREEYYNDLIQEYDHLSHETITDMVDVGMMIHWMNDGNVEKIGEDTYIEQTTQWKKEFTMVELEKFYMKEFIEN
jgi:hypothetical protein|tara:strand:+ start:369 stop:611 length:243 start_codon:yes stop_codon:yes gene_type:complete